jgi:two-component system cell cycle response regulator CpdR
MKILVAEDEEFIAEAYRLVLESRKHEVIITRDGAECLDAFNKRLGDMDNNGSSKNSPFDLVILDYRMPKKNGLEAAVEIRSKSPSQRILMATAYGGDIPTSELGKSSSDQPIELINKPFEFDQFFAVVEKGSSKFVPQPQTSANAHYSLAKTSTCYNNHSTSDLLPFSISFQSPPGGIDPDSGLISESDYAAILGLELNGNDKAPLTSAGA